MTLAQLEAVLQLSEQLNGSSPELRLRTLLFVLRSLDQNEVATIEGVDSAVVTFKTHYGPISHNSVRALVTAMIHGKLGDKPVSMQLLLAMEHAVAFEVTA